MNRPGWSSSLVAALEQFGSRWSNLCDFIQVHDHPLHTTLRLIRGVTDVSISCDQADYCIYIAACHRMPDETDDSWLANPGVWGRPIYTLEQYLQQSGKYTPLVRASLGKSVDRRRLDQVQKFLELHIGIIDEFVEHNLAN